MHLWLGAGLLRFLKQLEVNTNPLRWQQQGVENPDYGHSVCCSFRRDCKCAYYKLRTRVEDLFAIALTIWAHPLTWSVLPDIVHLWGCMAFRHDVEIVSPPSRRKKGFRERVRRWAQVRYSV
jgi:hypothetical protein